MALSVFDIAARYVYPALKKRLAEKLAEKGFTQVSIARLLGVTQSTVSRYLRDDRVRDAELHPRLEEELDVLAEALARGAPRDAVDACLANLVVKALGEKLACNIHQRLDPRIDPSACSLCPRVFRPAYRDTRSCIHELWG